MPANKYALLRYRIIDRCISNKYDPYPTKEDLRQACENELYGSDGDRISMSTIDKDLFAMRNESNLGYYAPIAYHKTEKGYYYEDPDYTIDDLPLNQEDVEAIEFAANTLSQFRGIPLFQSSGDAIDKILGRLSLRPDLGQSNEQFVLFDTSPQYGGSVHLKGLLEAIQEQRVVRFEYQKYSNSESKTYTFHPYLLKEYRNRWYAIGQNPEKEAVVVFALDRIISDIEISAQKFERVNDFDFQKYFENSIGITVSNDPPVNIRIRFSPLAAKYVESQPWHATQKVVESTDDHVDMEFELCTTPELTMQILSFGNQLEVLHPKSLVAAVKSAHLSALERYN